MPSGKIRGRLEFLLTWLTDERCKGRRGVRDFNVELNRETTRFVAR